MKMPHVSVIYGSHGNPVYQVGGKSFIFFRNPRPDATDPDTGERYPDVIMFWVESAADKLAMIQDEGRHLHNISFRRPPFGADPREPDRRAHPARVDRDRAGCLAVPRIGQEGRDLAQRARWRACAMTG